MQHLQGASPAWASVARGNAGCRVAAVALRLERATRTRQYSLKSRATDASGAKQPAEHDENFGSYVVNHTVAIEVSVR